MSQSAILAASDDVPPIDLRNLTWVALALLVLVAAIVLDSLWLLNFIHVMAGVMWTGIDLFMGFVIVLFCAVARSRQGVPSCSG